MTQSDKGQLTNAELADELDAEVKNERSGKIANMMMRASAALRQSEDIPLCAGHADWWFTSRNHLKGDTTCVVCAFNPQPSSTPREIFYQHREGYAGPQPAVWMDDWRRMRARAETAERSLTQAQARCAEVEKALTRLGSMEAFRGPRFVTEHDAELIARIDFARAALKKPR